MGLYAPINLEKVTVRRPQVFLRYKARGTDELAKPKLEQRRLKDHP